MTNGVVNIVNAVVQKELTLAPSQGRWMYLASYEKDGARIVARKIQTDDGILTWILSRNKEPLSPAEIERQRKHLDDLASDPSLLDANRKAMRDDATRVNSLLADLPQGVRFNCLIQSGSEAEIYFVPRIGYGSLNVEKRVIGGMSGKLRVDLKEMRLLAASGSEQTDLSLFFGLGRIYKDSSVSLTRTQVAPGIWETASVSMHIKGQVFFLKTIAQDADESRTDYVSVPTGLSARAAIDYLATQAPTINNGKME